MKVSLLAMHPLTRWSVVVLIVGAAGCWGRNLSKGSDAAASGDDTASGDDGPIDAATNTDLDTGTADSSSDLDTGTADSSSDLDTGTADSSSDPDTGTADSGSEIAYSGVVLTKITQDEATTGYVSRAVFTTEPRPTIGGCPNCCCGIEERGLPTPVKPPDAGNITIAAAAGATTTLATLVPELNRYHGMSDLGWSWFRPISDYGPVDSQPWNFGDALQVLATGNEVESFSGVLQTGPSLAGVMPPIGPSPVVVDRSQAFEISWTPEGAGDATVMLRLPYSGGVCYCDAPDSAGRLVVDANLLGPISVEQTGKIKLARLTISTVVSGNATIDLVGAVIQEGPLVIK